jgi:transposase InsO family protein
MPESADSVGERHFRRALADFVVHYHRERNHQELGNELIDGTEAQPQNGRVQHRQRVGGLLSYYYRAA